MGCSYYWVRDASLPPVAFCSARDLPAGNTIEQPSATESATSAFRLAAMVKVLCVLYEDPTNPSTEAPRRLPEIKSYPGGQTTPTPTTVDFVPGQLLLDSHGAIANMG